MANRNSPDLAAELEQAQADGDLTDHAAASEPACELGAWHEGPCVPLADHDSFYDTP